MVVLCLLQVGGFLHAALIIGQGCWAFQERPWGRRRSWPDAELVEELERGGPA